jgi:hypothetical protein
LIRRALLLAPVAAAAQGSVLQGTASRRYLGFRVYEAQLFLPCRAATPAEAADPCEIRVRYLRAVSLPDVRRAWEASLGALDLVFVAWLRPLAEGDEERYGFSDQGARLEGPGRPLARLATGPGTAALRASWLGPQAPAALLRGWFPAA